VKRGISLSYSAESLRASFFEASSPSITEKSIGRLNTLILFFIVAFLTSSLSNFKADARSSITYSKLEGTLRSVLPLRGRR